MKRTLVVSSLLLGVAGISTQAHAQAVNLDGAVDIQNFRLSPSPNSILLTENSDVLQHLEASGGFGLHFSKDPLLVKQPDGEKVPIIDDQLVGEAMGAIGVADWFEVGISVPLYLLNNGDVGGTNIDGATMGEMSVQTKMHLLSREHSPVGVAAELELTLPTGNDQAFTSSGGVTFSPGVIADLEVGDWLFIGNLSTKLQKEQQFADLDVSHQMRYSFGAQYGFTESWFGGTEVFGSTTLNDFFEPNKTPAEGLVSIKHKSEVGIQTFAGAGGGIIAGVGSPAYRLVAGVRYAPENRDTDGDGILNLDDACPEVKEDFNGIDDTDGCPDPDRDKDGFPDSVDPCPDEYGEKDGCPVRDSDGDGLLDDVDKCPLDPEDPDKFQDEDGCPDPDNDEDTVLDVNDKCDGQKEDIDGFEDADGCPDPDNDGDGVLDKDDKCPLRKGKTKFKGCPGKKKVVLVKNELKILDKIYFQTGKAKIKKQSFPLLDEVHEVLASHPEVLRVEIQGHTDDRGNDRYNLKLSDERAKAVREYLVQKGIAAERLTAKGYGESAPSVPIKGLRGRKLKEARAANRRVQFTVTEFKKRTVEIEVAPDEQ